MSIYFLDTSAVVKRYVLEKGTQWINGLSDPSAGNSLHVARITTVEVVSAMSRRSRSGSITPADLTQLLTRFRFDLGTQYQVVELTSPLLDEAMRVAEAHALRGYDAVQLAALLAIRRVLSQQQLPPPVLVSADVELNAAATGEGFQTEDPNTH